MNFGNWQISSKTLPLSRIVFESTYGLLLECEYCVFAGISQTTNNEMQLLLALILHFVSLTVSFTALWPAHGWEKSINWPKLMLLQQTVRIQWTIMTICARWNTRPLLGKWGFMFVWLGVKGLSLWLLTPKNWSKFLHIPTPLTEQLILLKANMRLQQWHQ